MLVVADPRTLFPLYRAVVAAGLQPHQLDRGGQLCSQLSLLEGGGSHGLDTGEEAAGAAGAALVAAVEAALSGCNCLLAAPQLLAHPAFPFSAFSAVVQYNGGSANPGGIFEEVMTGGSGGPKQAGEGASGPSSGRDTLQAALSAGGFHGALYVLRTALPTDPAAGPAPKALQHTALPAVARAAETVAPAHAAVQAATEAPPRIPLPSSAADNEQVVAANHHTHAPAFEEPLPGKAPLQPHPLAAQPQATAKLQQQRQHQPDPGYDQQHEQQVHARRHLADGMQGTGDLYGPDHQAPAPAAMRTQRPLVLTSNPNSLVVQRRSLYEALLALESTLPASQLGRQGPPDEATEGGGLEVMERPLLLADVVLTPCCCLCLWPIQAPHGEQVSR